MVKTNVGLVYWCASSINIGINTGSEYASGLVWAEAIPVPTGKDLR